MTDLFISPTEPKEFAEIGTVSSIPEKFGADILILGKFGTCGIQRKEVRDFVNSLYYDDRMAIGVGKMKQLDIAIWMIEGKWNWNRDGVSLTVPTFTRVQMRGLMFSLQFRGFWILSTETKQESIELLLQLTKWLEQEEHQSLSNRKNPVAEWGRVSNKDWGCHLLQGFEGIKSKLAGRIYDHFQGVPLAWTCDIVDLMEVDGIGIKRAQMLMEALDNES